MLTDRSILELAARAALRAAGRVEPNPLVGAVLVSPHPPPQREIIGIGHHRRFGGPHAEQEALNNCLSQGFSPRGASMYVTLEPCNAQGRNPPCVDAIIKAGISEVIYALPDSSPLKGGGASRLRDAGINARLCTESPLASGIAAPFIKRLNTGLPWVIAKWAQTIDGRIATRSGESKWISSESSRRRVHALRARVDAIMTGIGTVLADDPTLNARGVPIRRTAARIIVDTDLDIRENAKVITTARDYPTFIACDATLGASTITADKRERLKASGASIIPVQPSASGRGLDLRALLSVLWKDHGFSTIMIESGPGLLGSLFDLDLIDEAVVYIAPLILGDELAKSVAVGRLAETLSAARRYTLWRHRQIESDIELTYRRIPRF